jgi:hypothetical protein
MLYFVTHGSGGLGAIDQGNPEFDLDGALAHACELLGAGAVCVTISDNAGRSISGDDLTHCCNCDKTLTADLRAIPNEGSAGAP